MSGRSDDKFPIVDGGLKSPSGHGREVDGLRNVDALGPGGADNRLAEGMFRLTFGAGDQTEDRRPHRASTCTWIRRIDPEVGHRGMPRRERSGLVKDNGRDKPGALQGVAPADQDTPGGAFASGDDDGRRRGESHRARTGNDQDGDQ